ncbi:MAG: PepSY-like domain-containing protein [Tannerella sp.]|jgi:hypothetical protein|nr:PepSY-like domain-containing protein [Tannerella sp.]
MKIEKLNKYVIGIVASVLFFCQGCETQSVHILQENMLPNAAVLNAFKSMYPNAKEAIWKKEEAFYAVDFYRKSVSCQAWYAENGDWLQSREELSENRLPRPVTEALSRSVYAEWTTTKAYLLERKEHVLIYRVDVVDRSMAALYYSAGGDLIKVRNEEEPVDFPLVLTTEVKEAVTVCFGCATILDVWNNAFGIQICLLDEGICKVVAYSSSYEWLASIWVVPETALPAAVMTCFRSSRYGEISVDKYGVQVNAEGLSYLFYFREGGKERIMRVAENGEMLYVISTDSNGTQSTSRDKNEEWLFLSSFFRGDLCYLVPSNPENAFNS